MRSYPVHLRINFNLRRFCIWGAEVTRNCKLVTLQSKLLFVPKIVGRPMYRQPHANSQRLSQENIKVSDVPVAGEHQKDRLEPGSGQKAHNQTVLVLQLDHPNHNGGRNTQSIHLPEVYKRKSGDLSREELWRLGWWTWPSSEGEGIF